MVLLRTLRSQPLLAAPLVVGLLLYFVYGFWHSRLTAREASDAARLAPPPSS